MFSGRSFAARLPSANLPTPPNTGHWCPNVALFAEIGYGNAIRAHCQTRRKRRGYVGGSSTWTIYGGHQYALTSSYGTWEEAQAEAVAAGGNLVTIDDVAERDFLTTFAQDTYCRDYSEPMHNAAWIGLYYLAGRPGDGLDREGWRWVATGGVPSENVWNPHPSNSVQNGDHMAITGANHPSPGMFGNNEWHDDYLGYNFRGIIEIVPEPSTIVLFSIAAFSLFAYAWRRRR